MQKTSMAKTVHGTAKRQRLISAVQRVENFAKRTTIPGVSVSYSANRPRTIVAPGMVARSAMMKLLTLKKIAREMTEV